MAKKKLIGGKSYWLAVDHPKHTEVLGCRVSSKYGPWHWNQLDWNHWWLDGPAPHMFNSGGTYFHVRCKYDTDQDGAEPIKENEHRWFRVRCFYAGGKFRGKEVTDIDIGMQDGKLHWIVRTKEKA